MVDNFRDRITRSDQLAGHRSPPQLDQYSILVQPAPMAHAWDRTPYQLRAGMDEINACCVADPALGERKHKRMKKRVS